MATAVNNVALQTELLKVSPDDSGQANHRVTLQITDSRTQEKRIVTGYTDFLIAPLGLGEQTYGFDPAGKRAERIIEENEKIKTGVPKVSTTLRLYRGTASRYEQEPGKGLGEVLVIEGVGDSTKTIIENLTGFFIAEGIEEVRKRFSKIYVIAKGSPKSARDFVDTQRPRYIGIADVIDRDNREGLVSFIDARVGDFDYVDPTLPYEERKLQLFDENGKAITNGRGQVIQADNIVAATGFRSKLESIFGDYLEEGVKFKNSRQVESFTLPTNPDISVGTKFVGVDTILITGVAATADFNEEKLLNLPPGARSALSDISIENAVAVGFRSPESQAAVREFLRRNGLVYDPGDQELEVSYRDPQGFQAGVFPGERFRLPFGAQEEARSQPGDFFSIPYTPDIGKGLIPRGAGPELIENSFIAFLSEQLARYRFLDDAGNGVSGDISLEITRTQRTDGLGEQLNLVVRAMDGFENNLGSDYLYVLEDAFSRDEFLVAYSNEILNQSRSRSPRIDLGLRLNNGSIMPSETELRA
jgi:hypothetical protein